MVRQVQMDRLKGPLFEGKKITLVWAMNVKTLFVLHQGYSATKGHQSYQVESGNLTENKSIYHTRSLKWNLSIFSSFSALCGDAIKFTIICSHSIWKIGVRSFSYYIFLKMSKAIKKKFRNGRTST